MSDNRFSVIVLGATGMVGQRLLQLLDGHSHFRVDGVAGSARSQGRSYSEASPWRIPGAAPSGLGARVVRPLEPQAFPGEPGIALSALPADAARRVEPAFAEAGWTVVSNASAFRAAPEVPLVMPEINPGHLALLDRQDWPGALVTNPNCVAIPLTLALKPLHDAVGLEAVTVATYQAVSGAGFAGETAWDMIGSVHPHPGDEEEKVESEPRRLLGRLGTNGVEPADFPVSARCVRVPVRDGHLCAVSVKTKQPIDPTEAERLFASWHPPITDTLPTAPSHPLRVVRERNRPAPAYDADAGNGMQVTVGRIETCPVMDLKFHALGHNTVRGAAGAALLNAELLAEQRAGAEA